MSAEKEVAKHEYTLVDFSEMPKESVVSITVGAVLIAFMIIKYGAGLKWGKLSIIKRTDRNVDAINKRLDDMEKQHRKDQLEARIHDEFQALRLFAKDQKERVYSAVWIKYSEQFKSFCDKYFADQTQEYRNICLDLYCKNLAISMDKKVSKEMIRLIFQNKFKPLPLPTDTAPEAEKKNREFEEDVHGRAEHLLNTSYKFMSEEWAFSVSRNIFFNEYIACLYDFTIKELTRYFREVVKKRNEIFDMMFYEYGDMYVSFNSFKSYVESKFTSIFGD